MADEVAKVNIIASDLPDSILKSERMVGKHNMLHDLADYTDELKGYAPPEKEKGGSTNQGLVATSPSSPAPDTLIDKIVREHRNCHENVAEYPEACNDFYTGGLDSTLEPVDLAVFKIAKAQARRAENDRCDEGKCSNLLNKLMGAFKGEG